MSLGISAAGWAAIAAAVAAAAGSAVSASESSDAAARQQRIIEQAAEEDARLNNKKEIATNQYAQENFTPETRRQNLENAATQNETSLIDSLLKAQGGSTAEVKSGAEGNLSQDYTKAAGAATAAAGDDIIKRARLMARTNAPSLLYQQDAQKGADLASEIAGLNSQSGLNAKYTNNALNRAQNKGSLAGGLLQGVGAAAAGYAGSQMAGSGSSSGADMFGANSNGRIIGKAG